MKDIFHDENGNFVFDKLLQFHPHNWSTQINSIGELLGKKDLIHGNTTFNDDVLFFDCIPPISIYENLYLIGYKLVARSVIGDPKIYTVTNWVIDEETFIRVFPTEINSSYVSFNFLQVLLSMAIENIKVPLLINIMPLHYDINFKNRKECDDLVKLIMRLRIVNELIALNKEEKVTYDVNNKDLTALRNPIEVKYTGMEGLLEALDAMLSEDNVENNTDIINIKSKLGYYNNPWVIMDEL